jgi:hypothetical protein
MECWTVRPKLSAYIDHALPEQERCEVRAHIARCHVCGRAAEGFDTVRAALRGLPAPASPADLAMRLRVMASRERTRSLKPRLDRAVEDLHLALHNLMQPLALPMAGGLLSAMLLFMALVPTFTFWRTPGDVPTGLSTGAALKSLAPIGFNYGDAEVDLIIDGNGSIVNYKIVDVGPGADVEALRRSIENNLLFTQFTPATAFGQPISGALRVSFRSSRIDVKG